MGASGKDAYRLPPSIRPGATLIPMGLAAPYGEIIYMRKLQGETRAVIGLSVRCEIRSGIQPVSCAIMLLCQW